MKASSQPIRATGHTPTPSLRQSMEVVDPDQNAADRLHVVTIAAVTQFCKGHSPPLRADYFRRMLRGEQDEHRGWMLRATVSNRWIRHTCTGEYVAVVGKVTDFIKNYAQKRPANDMPFLPDGNALAKLLADTYTSDGKPSNNLHDWEKVSEPHDVWSKLNKSNGNTESQVSSPSACLRISDRTPTLSSRLMFA